MAEGELPPVGTATLRGNDAVPLVLACRTVAKVAAKLAMGAESNEAEVQVLRCLRVQLLIGPVLVEDARFQVVMVIPREYLPLSSGFSQGCFRLTSTLTWRNSSFRCCLFLLRCVVFVLACRTYASCHSRVFSPSRPFFLTPFAISAILGNTSGVLATQRYR